ncbi:hypothetical protein BZA05DRAFT_442659 [Tricharina praecox]|uniref:uncharacterized protein n=1 Tax=Tricharina praecox TaxID=43433 RepID=UPI00221F87BA|nr:uncharacterized protein BZA05DRAFT_442659 [Tricharina praecox]KAI5855992.1 hypothetical protein BZA05DRAFT_442659 [Tricharina praecox]
MRLQQIASLSLLSLGLLTRYVAANPVPNALAFAEAVPQDACPIDCGSICCTLSQHCASTSTCGEGAAAVEDGSNVFTSTFLITRTEAAVITSLVVFTSTGAVATGTGTAAMPTMGITTGGSVIVPYPTLRPSGTNTFLVPIPSGTGFNDVGIIGGGSSDGVAAGAAGGLTPAQIGGIVGGILGAFFLIALILICCCMRRGFNGFAGWMNSWGHKETTHTAAGGAAAHHGHSGAGAAAGGGMLGYLLGRKSSTQQSSGHHVVAGGSSGVAKKTGMAALLGGAAAGLTSIFASRRKTRMSEKYSTTDISSGYYTSDITSNTTYTSESTSDSSSSSSSSSESGHPHHGRH